MAKQVKNFIVPLVVYPFDVMISIGESDARLFKQLDKYCDLTDEDKEGLKFAENGRGRTMILSTNQTVLRLKEPPISTEYKGVLAHEIFHVVTFILDRVGMKLNLLHSDEAYAYLIGYLTEQIYTILGK